MVDVDAVITDTERSKAVALRGESSVLRSPRPSRQSLIHHPRMLSLATIVNLVPYAGPLPG